MTNSSPRPLRVLVVGGRDGSSETIARLLRQDGHAVETPRTLAAALAVSAAAGAVDALVCDLELADGDGGAQLRQLLAAVGDPPAPAADGKLVQEALELRGTADALAERSRRLYEEANDLVERLRRVGAAVAGDANA